jgi:iron(III) transport system permease protein
MAELSAPLSGETTRPFGIVAARARQFMTPTAIVSLILALILLFLVANPLIQLVKESLTHGRTGDFTFTNYVAAFARPRYVQAFSNSLQLGFWVALLAGAIGVPLAWAVSRTDMPCRGLVHGMVIGSFLIPPFVGAIGWILLGGPNAGWINRIYMAVTGASSGPFNIFTF